MNFINIVREAFAEIQKEYDLNFSAKKDEVTYFNQNVSFSVCYEKKMELYICFDVKGSSYRLFDLAKYIGFNDEDINKIAKNQVTNEESCKRVLDHLKKMVYKVFSELDDLTLLKYAEQQQKELKSKQVLEQLNRAWDEKNFEEYVEVYKNNMECIPILDCESKLKKRFVYAQRQLGSSVAFL
ncbi:MAG: hypothetical protein IKD31_03175 [Clostridia bacterium]|nr:hypothetical protein [Clostridia bacterium]